MELVSSLLEEERSLERVSFSLLFGGGAEFSSGEDSLFVADCIRKRLKLFADTYELATVDDATSTWYKGIDEKFYIGRGRIYHLAYPSVSAFLMLYYS